MRRSVVLLLLGGLASVAAAQGVPPQTRTIPVPDQPGAIRLNTGGIPGRAAQEQWETAPFGRSVKDVTQATLVPVLPAAGKATGAAAIVAPGGAFMVESIDLEGYRVARWLADHGIAAFVLKYRIYPQSEIAKWDREKMLPSRPFRPGEEMMLKVPAYAVEDAEAAIRLVRARAGQWGIDPNRVGMVGFSAGAMLTLQTTLQAPPDAMPSFIAPIYAPMNPVDVPNNAPPLFTVIATDDNFFGRMGYGLVQSWVAAGKKAEMHVYQSGGHGFGLGTPGTPVADWPGMFLKWLDLNGLLRAR